MNELKQTQFVLQKSGLGCTYNIRLDVHCYDKVQTRISAVNYFVLPMLHKGTLVLSAREALTDKLTLECNPLLNRKAVVVFREARLALLVYH